MKEQDSGLNNSKKVLAIGMALVIIQTFFLWSKPSPMVCEARLEATKT